MRQRHKSEDARQAHETPNKEDGIQSYFPSEVDL
jgi:hypothetical protein